MLLDDAGDGIVVVIIVVVLAGIIRHIADLGCELLSDSDNNIRCDYQIQIAMGEELVLCAVGRAVDLAGKNDLFRCELLKE